MRPQAYEWLGRALAEQGVQTVIPEFFADLAVTGKDRADALIAHYAAGRTVVIGGTRWAARWPPTTPRETPINSPA